MHGQTRHRQRDQAAFDAFNGIVWLDDKQVVDVRVTKVWSDTPQLVIAVSEKNGTQSA